MTDDNLRDRIAAVAEDHDVEQDGVNYWQCTCGDKFYLSQDEYRSWQEHLADAVIRELGNLRQEPHRFQCGSDDCIRYRIISDWTPNE